MHKRKGFALLTVMLVGAVLLASVFMLAKAIGTEQYIGQTSEYFRLALDMSEAGVTRTIQDLRLEQSAGVIGGSYLTPTDFVALTTSPGTVDLHEAIYSELTSGREIGTYHVTATRVSGPTTLTNGSNEVIVTLKSEGRVYPSNVTLTTPVTATNYESRRFVGVDVRVVYGSLPGHTEFNGLAVFSDGDMTLKGGATIYRGGAYSNTTIDFNGGSNMVQADNPAAIASAKNGVTGWGDGIHDGITTGYEIPFPPIDLPKFQQFGWGFATGGFPYDTGLRPIDPTKIVNEAKPDGYDNTDPIYTNAYPNTSSVSSLWWPKFQGYLAALGAAYSYDAAGGYYYLTSEDFDGAVSTFLTSVQAMMKDPGNQPPMPKNLLDAAVFYFKGDVSQQQATTDWHAGIYVIDGSLKLTGKSTNNISGVLPAVYATGSIDLEGNPGTRFKGLFVAGTSFSITSNASVQGAVWSGGTLTLGGNDNNSSPRAKVIYDDSIGKIPIPFGGETRAVTATPMAGTWKELPN